MTTAVLSPALRPEGDRTWKADAACAGHPEPDLFYPDPAQTRRADQAKQICEACPVSRICLDHALETRDRWGIRGGLTEEERHPLHQLLPRRLDYERVAAALEGHRVHLSRAERDAVVRVAHIRATPIPTWAPVLKITRKHGRRLVTALHDQVGRQPHLARQMAIEADLVERMAAAA
ncbi:WhiB family transcriptional regulator [Peterkaempfera griseoplana]|uniref:WhiB family transcriptional regulator n=1 Tax=Peterkaempfera griseoplana TaxID=66896 RepID=UPI0006E24BAB|nr:WhiB family transcriptional regulator [Peterkaempfera griseoplana]